VDWFARRLLDWHERHGRKDLPWQQQRTPYRVWVSEIMLQQTQVATVVPYYQRFMAAFPNVAALAAAGLDDVLHHWTGLGYYARGRNLHRAARLVMTEHGGRFPDEVAALTQLPGIGRSTAGAIAAIAGGRHAAILDGNVKRVLARFHAVRGYPGDAAPLRALWQHAEAHTPAGRPGDYAQAIMDLGATACTRSRPRCDDCPVAERCAALAAGIVAELPERKARREKPVRAARMFLVTDPAGRCLLERRPASGIWGGLWTPPERAPETSVDALCGEFGIGIDAVAGSRCQTSFRHTFSHYHLDIEPVSVTLSKPVTTAADRDDVRWYAGGSSNDAPALGLSAPALRLLRDLP
jgi:A/G-specific adenine glycosylase